MAQNLWPYAQPNFDTSKLSNLESIKNIWTFWVGATKTVNTPKFAVDYNQWKFTLNDWTTWTNTSFLKYATWKDLSSTLADTKKRTWFDTSLEAKRKMWTSQWLPLEKFDINAFDKTSVWMYIKPEFKDKIVQDIQKSSTQETMWVASQWVPWMMEQVKEVQEQPKPDLWLIPTAQAYEPNQEDLELIQQAIDDWLTEEEAFEALLDFKKEQGVDLRGEQEAWFLQRLWEDWFKRAWNVWQAWSELISGKWEPVSTSLYTVWNVIWWGWDIIGELLASWYKTAWEPWKEQVKQILNTPAWQWAIKAIQWWVQTYWKWASENKEASRALEWITNIGSLFLGWKAKEKVWEWLLQAWKEKVWQKLIKSAEKNISEALAPAGKELKAQTTQITPEFLKKWIVWSQESILKQAEKWKEIFGKAIWDAIEEWALEGKKIKTSSLIDKLWEIEKSALVDKNIADVDKIKKVRNMLDEITQFWDELSWENARLLRKTWDEIINRQKWFNITGAEKLDTEIRKAMSNTLREELAKASPDLAKLNKEYNFYSKLAKITWETIERTKPQQGILRKVWATIFGWEQQWVLNKVIWYIWSKAFLDLTSSSLYKTLWAKQKQKIANWLMKWETQKVSALNQFLKAQAWINTVKQATDYINNEE